MNRFLLTVFLLLTFATAGPLSLHDAQQLLFANNHAMRNANIALEKARSEVEEARAAWFPSLDAKASFIYNSDNNRMHLQFPDAVPLFGGMEIDQEIGSRDRTEFALDCTYPLFTGFTRKYHVAATLEQVASREAMREGIKNQLSLQLGILYLEWCLSYRETALREMHCRQLSVRRTQVEQEYTAGLIIKSRYLEVCARQRMADVDLVSARQKIDSLRYELTTFIGLTDDSLLPDTMGSTISRFSLPPGIDTTRPELTALKKNMAQVHLLTNVIRGGRLPVLAGVVGFRYGKPGLNMGTDEFMGYGQVGLQLSWNLFDGFKRRAQEKQMQYRLEDFAVELDRLFKDFSKAYALALQQAIRIDQRVAAAREASEAAQALVDDLANCLEAGTVTQAEYLDALSAATQAQLVVEQMTIARRMALLRVQFAAGATLLF